MDIRTCYSMKKIFAYIFCLTAIGYLAACQQKVICPAYHSYFILDVDETRKAFTLFGPDSLPVDKWKVDKEKYGIAKAKPYNRKLQELRTISMVSVYKPLEDPFEQFRRQYAESDSGMVIDSAAVLAKSRVDNDFQNIDQMIYLHHFGKYLPSKTSEDDELKKDMTEQEPLIQEEPAPEEKKAKKKFRLLGKKDKTEPAGESNDDDSGGE